MSEYVYPTAVCVVRWQGGRVHLRPDQQWRADDPFVMARPDFFSAVPRAASGTVPPPVEQATRAPGEKRATRRPAKKVE